MLRTRNSEGMGIVRKEKTNKLLILFETVVVIHAFLYLRKKVDRLKVIACPSTSSSHITLLKQFIDNHYTRRKKIRKILVYIICVSKFMIFNYRAAG